MIYGMGIRELISAQECRLSALFVFIHEWFKKQAVCEDGEYKKDNPELLCAQLMEMMLPFRMKVLS